MANTQDDLSSIVKGFVKEYVVPKCPIYRITFVESEITYEEGDPDITTIIRRCLFEINDEWGDGEHYCSFDDNYRITSHMLKKGKEKVSEQKGYVIYRGTKTYTIIAVERVA